MNRLLSAVCVAGCLLALGWMIGSAGGRAPALGSVTPAAAPGETAARGPDAVLLPVPRAGEGREVSAASPTPVVAAAAPLPRAQPPETQGLGAVVGQVSGLRGEPLARRVQFHEESGGDAIHWTRSGEDGYYRMGLGPGGYRVFHSAAKAGPHRESDPVFVFAGRVEVATGQETLFDITSAGTRSLRGGLAHGEHDGILLEVELVSAEDPDLVVAKALAVTDAGEKREYEAALRREDRDGDGHVPHMRRQPPGVGYFEMEGVPAGLYELRAYLDLDRRFYVTGQVDLRRGDVAFEPIVLHSAAFFEHRTLVLE